MFNANNFVVSIETGILILASFVFGVQWRLHGGGGMISVEKCIRWCLRSFVVSVSLVVITGCQNFYEGFRLSSLEQCYRLNYTEQEECFRENNMDYDSYKSLLEETTDGEKPVASTGEVKDGG